VSMAGSFRYFENFEPSGTLCIKTIQKNRRWAWSIVFWFCIFELLCLPLLQTHRQAVVVNEKDDGCANTWLMVIILSSRAFLVRPLGAVVVCYLSLKTIFGFRSLKKTSRNWCQLHSSYGQTSGQWAAHILILYSAIEGSVVKSGPSWDPPNLTQLILHQLRIENTSRKLSLGEGILWSRILASCDYINKFFCCVLF
jgi:hypothetical protein